MKRSNNDHFTMLIDLHRGFRKKEAQVAMMQEEMMMSPHRKEKKKFENNEVQDKIQQTCLTFNNHTGEMDSLPSQRHGAWLHVSCFESRV